MALENLMEHVDFKNLSDIKTIPMSRKCNNANVLKGACKKYLKNITKEKTFFRHILNAFMDICIV